MLFKNMFNDFQIEGKWEINTAYHNYLENCILILYQMTKTDNIFCDWRFKLKY